MKGLSKLQRRIVPLISPTRVTTKKMWDTTTPSPINTIITKTRLEKKEKSVEKWLALGDDLRKLK